jgi:hypothetical protein
MGQTFPLASPALYISTQGLQTRVYSVLESTDGGDFDSARILGSQQDSYTKCLQAGRTHIFRP